MEVAGITRDMDLNADSKAPAQGGPHAHVAGSQSRLPQSGTRDEHAIDPEGGKSAARDAEVGGGKTQLAAQAVASDHPAAQSEPFQAGSRGRDRTSMSFKP